MKPAQRRCLYRKEKNYGSQAIVSPDCDGTNPVDEIEEDSNAAMLKPEEPMYNILGQEVDALTTESLFKTDASS